MMKNQLFKQTLTIALLIFFFSSAYSQKYQKMLGDSNSWSVYNSSYTWNYFEYHYYRTKGDTIIKSINYKNLFFDGYGSGFLREDTLAKKIYYLKDTGAAEMLLYDFTLQVGDTFKFVNDANFFVHLTVTKIDSSTGRRVFIMKSNWNGHFGSFPDSSVWIEGVGSNLSLLLNNLFYDPDMNIVLTCAFKDTVQTYSDASYPCYSTTVGVEHGIRPNPNITLSPNPSYGNYSLNISENFTGEVLIYDMLGKVKYQANILDKNKLYINLNASAGIYFLKVNSADGNASSMKLIKY